MCVCGGVSVCMCEGGECVCGGEYVCVREVSVCVGDEYVCVCVGGGGGGGECVYVCVYDHVQT